MPESWQFWVDRGGTFTDIVARRPDGTLTTLFSFDFNRSGMGPHGALTLSPDGMLYGLTGFGGIARCMTVGCHIVWR